MAAENTGTSDRRRCDQCFNEAAAHGRGKLQARQKVAMMEIGFNEAAAHGRGKQRTSADAARTEPASMRPRRMAAENEAAAPQALPDRGGASMRPRRMAAENLPQLRLGGAAEGLASMRPRRMAAENARTIFACSSPTGLQ